MAKDGRNFRMSAFPVTIFAHLLVIAIATLVLVWLIKFREGFAFNSDIKAKIFNLHPLLMVLGFIILSGEAMMAYKVIPGRRQEQKLIHMILHLMALVAGILGVYAVFKFHHELKIPHIYSLHSWIGLSTISLFAFQWVVAFFSFWYPGAESGRRAKMAPWHIYFGGVIFLMAIVSAETGLTEKFFFLGLKRGQEALLINFTGLLLLLFAISVLLAIILPKTN